MVVSVVVIGLGVRKTRSDIDEKPTPPTATTTTTNNGTDFALTTPVSRRLWRRDSKGLCRSGVNRAAPSALESGSIPDPGLTAGATKVPHLRRWGMGIRREAPAPG